MNEITIWRDSFTHDTLFNLLLCKLGIRKKYWDKTYVLKFKLDKDHVVELYDEDMEAIKQGGNNV